jgi:hypothetical protein
MVAAAPAAGPPVGGAGAKIGFDPGAILECALVHSRQLSATIRSGQVDQRLSIDPEGPPVCELLIAAFDVPRSFRQIAPIAVRLEELGLAGFGWGLAWIDEESHAVRGVRGLHRFADEVGTLSTRASRRFLVHLRGPSRLSTVQLPDTQPFFDGDRSAWCHNGYFERSEELRAHFAGRLHGQADSEVGWQLFLDQDGDPLTALANVDASLGGQANLAYLGAEGDLCVYARNKSNRMWRFTLDAGSLVTTSLHSADGSLFDLVVPRATERERLELGTAVRIAGPLAAPGRSTAA